MESTFNLQGDLPILYILLAILILLALLAAIGAWVRGGGLKREDAENLFSESRENHREEILRLETALEQQRMESAQALEKAQAEMAARMRELNEQLTRSRTELETAVTQATRKNAEEISGELQSVTRTITEAERRTGTSLEGLSSSLENLEGQVRTASEAVTRSVSEIVRQQREQKAQSTVQLCDALITSLGTLKSTISNQISQGSNVVNADVEPENSSEELSAPSNWDSPFADETTSSAAADEQGEESYQFDSSNAGESSSEVIPPYSPGLASGISDAGESCPPGTFADEDTGHEELDTHTRETDHDAVSPVDQVDEENLNRDRAGF